MCWLRGGVVAFYIGIVSFIRIRSKTDLKLTCEIIEIIELTKFGRSNEEGECISSCDLIGGRSSKDAVGVESWWAGEKPAKTRHTPGRPENVMVVDPVTDNFSYA
jgi:hypothetical protein